MEVASAVRLLSTLDICEVACLPRKRCRGLGQSVESLRKGHEKVARTLDHIDNTLEKDFMSAT